MTGIRWTCPSIDQLGKLVRRHIPEPDRTKALAVLEEIRADNTALGAAAATASRTREDT